MGAITGIPGEHSPDDQKFRHANNLCRWVNTSTRRWLENIIWENQVVSTYNCMDDTRPNQRPNRPFYTGLQRLQSNPLQPWSMEWGHHQDHNVTLEITHNKHKSYIIRIITRTRMAPPTHKNQSKSYITRGRKGTKGLKEHSIPSSSILDLKHSMVGQGSPRFRESSQLREACYSSVHTQEPAAQQVKTEDWWSMQIYRTSKHLVPGNKEIFVLLPCRCSTWTSTSPLGKPHACRSVSRRKLVSWATYHSPQQGGQKLSISTPSFFFSNLMQLMPH